MQIFRWFLEFFQMPKNVADIVEIINLINEDCDMEAEEAKVCADVSENVDVVKTQKNLLCENSADQAFSDKRQSTAKSRDEKLNNNVNITANISRILQTHEGAYYHLREENLIVKKVETTFDNEWESQASLIMNHKNIAKTFLTIYAKKSDKFIQFMIGPYYEGEINGSTIKTPHDIHNLSKQLASGINYLHSRKVAHGNIGPDNIRFTIYNKTMNELQNKFIEESYSKIKLLVNDHIKNVEKYEKYGDECEYDMDGLIFLQVHKHTDLPVKTSKNKPKHQYQNPIYVLFDLSHFESFEPKYFTGDLSIYEPESTMSKEEKERRKIKCMQFDVLKFFHTVYFCSQLVINKKKETETNIIWNEWKPCIPARFRNSANTIERLLWQCIEEKNRLRPSLKTICKNFPGIDVFEEFVSNQQYFIANNPDKDCAIKSKIR